MTVGQLLNTNLNLNTTKKNEILLFLSTSVVIQTFNMRSHLTVTAFPLTQSLIFKWGNYVFSRG